MLLFPTSVHIQLCNNKGLCICCKRLYIQVLVFLLFKCKEPSILYVNEAPPRREDPQPTTMADFFCFSVFRLKKRVLYSACLPSRRHTCVCQYEKI
jgi:hypothetical protein